MSSSDDEEIAKLKAEIDGLRSQVDLIETEVAAQASLPDETGDFLALQTARELIEKFRGSLKKGCSMPTLDGLEATTERSGSRIEIGQAMFKLQCAHALYTRVEGDAIVPDTSMVLDPNDPAVRSKMAALFAAAGDLARVGFLERSRLPWLVQEELASKLAMSGGEFESWLLGVEPQKTESDQPQGSPRPKKKKRK
jgi:hypothetical protein